jgi:hypothetical protein
MKDMKGLNSFRGVPLRTGDVPHFKNSTPIYGRATLHPAGGEVWQPLFKRKLTVVNTETLWVCSSPFPGLSNIESVCLRS